MIKLIMNFIRELFYSKNRVVFVAKKNDYVAQMAGNGNCQDSC